MRAQCPKALPASRPTPVPGCFNFVERILSHTCVSGCHPAFGTLQDRSLDGDAEV
jgi:hypothetical protein